MSNIKQLQDIASVLRREMIENLGSTSQNVLSSNLSYTELLSCLFFSEIHIDLKNPDNPDNDEFIFSSPDSSKIINLILKKLGVTKEFDSENPWIKKDSEKSLLSLSISVGLALSAKLKNRKFRSFAFIEEDESEKGTFYEAMQFASSHLLNNLCVLLALKSNNSKLLKQKFDSLGFHTITINGNDIKQILSAFKDSNKSTKPVIILCNLTNGKGVSFLENKNEQYIVLDDSKLIQALKEIPHIKMPKIQMKKPKKVSVKEDKNKQHFEITDYKVTDLISTEQACRNAVKKLNASNKNTIYLDSSKTISEKNALGISLGLSAKGIIPFFSSSDTLPRANSKNPIIIFGKSYSDISSYRQIQNSNVLYPSDAISSEKLVKLAETLPNITFIRNSSIPSSILYKNSEEFPLSNFKILLSSSGDKVVIASSGNTVQEAMKAHNLLKNARIDSSILDLYSIKPFNTNSLIEFVKSRGNLLVVVEENYPEGSIGEMLSSSLINSGINIIHLPIKDNSQITANSILSSVKSFLEEKPLESLVKDEVKVKTKKSKIKSKKRT